MNASEVAAIIAGAGVLLSLVSSLLIVAFSYGRLTSRVQTLEASRAQLATKADVQVVSDKITEIRGMFRLVLKDGSDGL